MLLPLGTIKCHKNKELKRQLRHHLLSDFVLVCSKRRSGRLRNNFTTYFHNGIQMYL